VRDFKTIRWEGDVDGQCVIIDQTKLPEDFIEINLNTAKDAWQAIKVLAVRGAPAIGVAAAYGMLLGVRKLKEISSFIAELNKTKDYLDSSRPTAVNLSWATTEMLKIGEAVAQTTQDVDLCHKTLLEKAREIQSDDERRCVAIGQHGADLVPENGLCLTHCNAGALATAGAGTALSVFYAAQEQGKSFKVYADETRPLLQGGRLTAWELNKSGIDVTVICDSMAGFLMSQKKLDLIVVGSDRIAANGDIANKIGTYSVAVLAKEHNVPFYVAAPFSTFDMSLENGSQIPIEERMREEISTSNGKITVGKEVNVWNPAFDVTPAVYIEGIITEEGILRKNGHEDFVVSIKKLSEKLKNDT